MNTPAILIRYIFKMPYTAARAKWNVAESISSAGFATNAMRIAPTTAAAVNSVPRNKRPLPKNTVAKKTVFQVAEAVAQDADEPQECNPGKGDEIQPQRNGVRIHAEPRARLLRIGRN